MKIRELMEILSQYDPEMRASIAVSYSDVAMDKVEKRDILDYTTNEHQETILYVAGDYRSSQAPGYAHLEPKKWEVQKQKILSRLNDRSYRFWRNGNRNGIHMVTGSSQDHCWTNNYDPRMWKELEAEGKIIFEQSGYDWNCKLAS